MTVAAGMIVTHGIETPPPLAPHGSVVSIGVFDGVHLGHRAILARNLERARELGARATVITFAEHPKSLLLGRAPRTLTSLEHRLELFARAHIECVWVLHFDAALRALDARACHLPPTGPRAPRPWAGRTSASGAACRWPVPRHTSAPHHAVLQGGARSVPRGGGSQSLRTSRGTE